MALREPFPGFPPPLTTRPEGLLSMLGLQTNGSYPQHLKYDELQPTLDLLNWYLESRAEVRTILNLNMATATPGGFTALYTVPQQEVWILLAMTLQPTAVVTPCSLQLARARSNDQASRIQLGEPVALTASSFPLIASNAAVRYLIFRPSVEIGYHYVSGGAAPANIFNSCLRFVRCTI